MCSEIICCFDKNWQYSVKFDDVGDALLRFFVHGVKYESKYVGQNLKHFSFYGIELLIDLLNSGQAEN